MLPNDTYPSSSTGTTFPTHLVGGKEYPVGMTADAEGHIRGSLPVFGLTIPDVAAGAAKTHLEIWNGTAANNLRLRKLWASPKIDVAVTGVVGVRLDAFRTSAIGTGGTAAATTASAAIAAAFWSMDGLTALPAGISARTAPTAGAASSQYVMPMSIFTEETAPGAHLAQFFNLLPELATEQALEIPPGQGFKLLQNAVAGVGSISWTLLFSVE